MAGRMKEERGVFGGVFGGAPIALTTPRCCVYSGGLTEVVSTPITPPPPSIASSSSSNADSATDLAFAHRYR